MSTPSRISLKNGVINVTNNEPNVNTAGTSTLATTKYVRDAITTHATVANGSITTAKLADRDNFNPTTTGVTETKIASSAIDYYHLKNNSVAWDKLQNSAVVNTKIADNAVTTSKIADSTSTLTGVTTSKIADNAITTAKIETGAVTNNKISNNAITSSKILDGQITSSKLEPNLAINGPAIINSQNVQYIFDNYDSVNSTAQNTITYYTFTYNQGCAVSGNGQYQVVAVSDNYFVSNNYGVNWTRISANGLSTPSVVMTEDGQKQIIANMGGLQSYISTDYGSTWGRTTNLSGIRSISMSNDGTKIVYAKYEDNKIWYSSDSGANYTLKDFGSTNDVKTGMPIVRVSGNGEYIFVRGFNSYISTNFGLSWTKITAVNFGSNGYDSIWPAGLAMSFDGKYIVVPQSPDSTTGSTYISRDYGITWSSYSNLKAYGCDISNNGQIILINNYGGKHKYSVDGGITFTTNITSLSNFPNSGTDPIMPIACSTSDDGKYFLTVDYNRFYSFNNTVSFNCSLQVKSMTAGVVKSDVNGLLSSGTIGTNEIADNAITPNKLSFTPYGSNFGHISVGGGRFYYTYSSGGTSILTNKNFLSKNYNSTAATLNTLYGDTNAITTTSNNYTFKANVNGLYNLTLNTNITYYIGTYTVKLIIYRNESIFTTLYTSGSKTSAINLDTTILVELQANDEVYPTIDLSYTVPLTGQNVDLIVNYNKLTGYLLNSNNLIN